MGFGEILATAVESRVDPAAPTSGTARDSAGGTARGVVMVTSLFCSLGLEVTSLAP